MSACRWFGVRLSAPLVLLLQTWAAPPPLTTVQDTLFKADGSRFNGVVFVEWKGFDASDGSVIATHGLAVPIVNGVLRVQLVPTTTAAPGAVYQARYNSDGRVQFEETWAVPPSNTPLPLRDVRVNTSPVAPPLAGTQIMEADVAGLPADLSVRPVKGPGYYPSRVAYVNATGGLESVTGLLGDCVRVDGTSGPCGAQFVDNEVPEGAIDGTNAMFLLAGIPEPAASLSLYRNGLLQQGGLDFELSEKTITFLAGAAPQSGDTLLASYRTLTPTSGGSAFTKLFLSASLGPMAASRRGVPQPRLGPAPNRPAPRGEPQVICGATGAASDSTEMARLGKCAVAPGLLRPGDRIEVRFDYSREGASGFETEVRWGEAALIHGRCLPGDRVFTGWAQIAVHEQGAQWSSESWGALLAAAHGAGTVPATRNEPIVLELRGRVDEAGAGTVTLRNFTVTRYPALPAR